MKKLLCLIATVSAATAFAGEFRDKIPNNPEPGKCYARVVVPAKYKNVSEKIMSRPESSVIKTIPAKYGFVEEEVVVKEASEKSVVIPAVYATKKVRVMLEDEKRTIVTTPSKYKFVSKKIMVKPEGYEWKKGKGPLQKVDHATGEILCYTKTPAVYKTVKEKVLVREASSQERVIPARYGFVKKRVLVTPEEVVKKPIPAITKIVKVKKMVEPPRQITETIPAAYGVVNKKELVSESYTEWAPILCETNATRSVIMKVQSALASQGFYKGTVDGRIGSGTQKAVNAFQRKNGLATGGLTEETLEKLSVSI